MRAARLCDIGPNPCMTFLSKRPTEEDECQSKTSTRSRDGCVDALTMLTLEACALAGDAAM